MRMFVMVAFVRENFFKMDTQVIRPFFFFLLLLVLSMLFILYLLSFSLE